MMTFRYDDYGCGIIGKIWVGTDGPSGKFFQILVSDPEEKIRFVEELKRLDEMLPKQQQSFRNVSLKNVFGARCNRSACQLPLACRRACQYRGVKK